jgi:type IV pilus assembly protein PilE
MQPAAPHASKAFTLAELIIVLAILAIIVGIALPRYQKTVERAHWQAARDILTTIYASEEVYISYNDVYYAPGNWKTMYMDDPNSPEVSYSIAAAAKTFTATATRQTGLLSGSTQTIDETGVINDTGWPKP